MEKWWDDAGVDSLDLLSRLCVEDRVRVVSNF